MPYQAIIGISSILRCSQTLSLTGANNPIRGILPVKSYVKCIIDPIINSVGTPIKIHFSGGDNFFI